MEAICQVCFAPLEDAPEHVNSGGWGTSIHEKCRPVPAGRLVRGHHR